MKINSKKFETLKSIQKFSIDKNKSTKTVEELSKLVKNGFKRNILIGVLVAALGYIIAWPSFKLYETMQMKIQEWTDNQSRIAEKAEQPSKEEKQNTNS